MPAANNGNAHTASRWAGFLSPVADVEVSLEWNGEPCDALIALHARRSAGSALRHAQSRRDAAIAVVLTGTDLYRDLPGGNVDARHAIECARIVVVLQEAAVATLAALATPAVASRTRVVVQSASVVRAARREGDAAFVAVGHLRDEKDPATLWRAMRRLAAGSSDAAPEVTLDHLGAPLDAALAADAEATARDCPAYAWLGAQPHAATRRAIARARALVHPSRMEGGANAVVEAVRSGVPVLASRIDGNVGLLGGGYDGTFPVGDDAALAALMRRFLRDHAFAAHLAAQCAAREPLMRPACERKAVRALLHDLVGAPSE